ncbi:20657_t:CDS:10 [Entrophospora sp. SA101]|nr:20657_t:CDS:10 [Entrophospora sp. SA101]
MNNLYYKILQGQLNWGYVVNHINININESSSPINSSFKENNSDTNNESHIELDNDLDISTTSSHSVETVLEIKNLYGQQTQQTITPKLFDSDNIQPILADTFQEESTRTVAFVPSFMSEGEPLEVEDVIISHQVRHQVAIPPGYNYIPLSKHVSPAEPARIYPFELDPFQKVVAEYAIAQALKNKQRVIYTTPIKALSNQKYRELENSFGDVGLITGDVTIKPDASCLVMTTEIHYMKDKVWEETIILLLHQIHPVFLSATVPNAMEFAEWICKIHTEPCHIVYTDFHPMPLQHYIYPCVSDGIFMIADEKGNFHQENFKKVIVMLDVGANTNAEYIDYKGKKKSSLPQTIKGLSDVYKIVNMIMLKKYDPVIFFTFSRKECENLALHINHLDLNTDEEKDLIQQVFDNALNLIPEDDQNIPQFKIRSQKLRKLMGSGKKGIGRNMKSLELVGEALQLEYNIRQHPDIWLADHNEQANHKADYKQKPAIVM